MALNILSRFPLKLMVPSVILLFTIVIGLQSYITHANISDQRVEEQSQRNLTSLMHALQGRVEYLLSKDDILRVQDEISVLGSDPSFKVALLTNDQGKVIASSELASIGRSSADVLLAYDQDLLDDYQSTAQNVIRDMNGRIQFLTNREMIRAVYPVLFGYEQSEIRPTKVGLLVIQQSLVSEKRNAQQLVQSQSFELILFATVMTGLLVLLFHFVLTRRVNHLVRVVSDFSQGNLDARTGFSGRDELSRIGNAFNQMADRLAANINQRQQVEQDLQESRRRLATLMDNLPGVVYRCRNDQNWTMEFMSEGSLSLMGYPGEDFTSGRIHYAQIIHPDDQQTVWDKVQTALQDRVPFELEYRILRADGSERWVGERGLGVFNEDEQLEVLEGFITDITIRKRAVQSLHNAHAELEKKVEERTYELRRYEHILSTTSELITFVDNEYKYLAANQSFLNSFGYMESEVIGNTVQGVSGKEFFETVLKPNLDRALKGKKVHMEIWGHYHKVGRRCFEMSFDPYITDDGQINGVVTTSHDITQQKQARTTLNKAKEAAEDASKAKSQFLANMSHELRTPLNAIIGYSELLQETAEAEQRNQDLKDLENINTSGKHLLYLINEILDLAKIEAGKMELSPTHIDVETMVNTVVTNVMPMMDTNRNTLTVNYEKSIYSLYADEGKVRQCLLNLLSNAAKFTEGGKINLTVDQGQKNGSDWITFEVSDTGIGMSTEQFSEVMKPFAQADNTITRRYGGTGLGLAITCELVGMMSGEINVESKTGEGSVFTIKLQSKQGKHIVTSEPMRKQN